jgi:tetratricopeptide (TPR) repeat protein
VTIYVENSFVGLQNIKDEMGLSILERVLLAGRIFWFYLGKIFWPNDLLFFYPRWNVSAREWWQYLYPLAAIIFGAALWAVRKRWRAPLAMYCFFAAMLLPVIGLLNVYFFRYSFIADHFLYYAAIGPIVSTAGLAEKGLGLLTRGTQRFFRPVAYGLLLLVLGILTWQQSRLYYNAEILYREVIKKNPASWVAYNNLGIILSRTERYGEAMTILQQALKIKNDYAEVHNNIGQLRLKTGQIDEAIVSFRKALEIDPKNSEASKNIRIAYDVTISKRVAEELQKNPNPKDAIVVLEKALAEAESLGRGELAWQIRGVMDQFKKLAEIMPGKFK